MKKNKLHNCFGFTLQEIVVVIVVIGVLASLAIPNYVNSVEKVNASESINVLQSVYGAQKSYLSEYSNYTTNINDLDITIPGSKNFSNVVVKDGSVGQILAEYPRNTGAYTIKIKTDGSLCCTFASDPNICARVGFSGCT